MASEKRQPFILFRHHLPQLLEEVLDEDDSQFGYRHGLLSLIAHILDIF